MPYVPDEELDRIARKRASMKMGWYLHAGIYIAVNLMLAVLSASSGRHWAVFPALGWGIGLAAHGIITFLKTDTQVFDSMVARERRQLQAQREPW